MNSERQIILDGEYKTRVPSILLMCLHTKLAKRYSTIAILYLLVKFYIDYRRDSLSFVSVITQIIYLAIPLLLFALSILFILRKDDNNFRLKIDDAGIQATLGHRVSRRCWEYFCSFSEDKNSFIYKSSNGVASKISKKLLDESQQALLRDLSKEKVKESQCKTMSTDSESENDKIRFSYDLKDHELLAQYRIFHSMFLPIYLAVVSLPIGLVVRYCIVKGLGLDDIIGNTIVAIIFLGIAPLAVLIRVIAAVKMAHMKEGGRGDFCFSIERLESYSDRPYGLKISTDWPSITKLKETRHFLILIDNKNQKSFIFKRFFSEENLEKLRDAILKKLKHNREN